VRVAGSGGATFSWVASAISVSCCWCMSCRRRRWRSASVIGRSPMVGLPRGRRLMRQRCHIN